MLRTAAIAISLISPMLPDHSMTPGDVATTDVIKICKPGYASSVRYVSQATKQKVFDDYGIKRSNKYEVDHLISLQLGGSNAPSNLWPQSLYTTPYNAHDKDRLESTLHGLVCKGKMSILDAQRMIRDNWIDAYKLYVKD